MPKLLSLCVIYGNTLMLPWMTNQDIKAIETIFLSLKNRKHIDVLEWGAGGSTKYFTEFLSKNGITYNWTSLEYNKKWFDRMQVLSLVGVDFVLFDVGNNNLKQRYTNMDDYVNYPGTLGKKFDVIIIDGRKRRRCIINSYNLLKEDGVVLLHDASRIYYRCAFNTFPIQRFLTKDLWMGQKK